MKNLRFSFKRFSLIVLLVFASCVFLACAQSLENDSESEVTTVDEVLSEVPVDDYSVRLGFWNVRDLSVNSRDESERIKICDVLENFDVVAICEINDSQIIGELESILDSRGEQWSSITSEKVGNSPQSSEHYGVLFKEEIFDIKWEKELSDKVLSDLELGIPDPNRPNLTVEQGKTFDREPYAVSLITDDERMDFVFIIVHVTWGSNTSPRIVEVRALAHYYNDVFPDENDVIICGDFNRNVGDQHSLGWLNQQIGVIDTTTGNTPTHISSNSTYDHILIHPDFTKEFSGTVGVIKFDETMFNNDDDAANLALSDHRPVWIELIVPANDDD